MPFSAQNFPSIERDESGDIDQVVQAQVPSFCENTQCPDYGKVRRENLRKFGKTRRGTQRWQCKTCQATLTFSPMSAKRHTKLPVSPSDLVPDLPRLIETVVLKAMAQDPSERYTDVSQFLRTLQVASVSPSYLVSRSRVAPAFGTFRDSKLINYPRMPTDYLVQVGQLKFGESLSLPDPSNLPQ